MIRPLGLLSGFLLLCSVAVAQSNRYMVFFKDKAGTPYSTDSPLDFLSQKAIDRRVRHNVPVMDADLPVNGSYVEGVRATGAETFFTSRWANAVLVQAPESLLDDIAALPYVDRTEFVAPGAKLINNGRRGITMRKKNGSTGAETQTQLSMIGVTDMHADNYHGEGITIAVLDAGFPGVNTADAFEHIFQEKRYDSLVSHDFVRNTDDVFQYDDHGTNVLSVIAGSIPDVFTGGAYKARFQLYVTEDWTSELKIEEYNWLFAAERADSSGVDIISTSLGYYDFDKPWSETMDYTNAQMDGKTAVITKAAQWAADRGVLVVCSAGNEGNLPWRIITAPADAMDVIAVGNVNAQGIVSSSSSRGPAADGRIKPDVSALGTQVRVIYPDGTTHTATGTSVAAPLITSLVAGVWQRYPELTNKQIIETLRKTSSHAANPNINIGYGIPHYKAVVNYLEQTLQPNIFEVFPNPIADTVNVRPFDPEQITACTVEILTAHGQLVRKDAIQFSWLRPSYQADLSQLPVGLYYLRVSTGAKHFVFKVVRN